MDRQELCLIPPCGLKSCPVPMVCVLSREFQSSGQRNARGRRLADETPLKARLGRKGRQLELVRPTGFVLRVEVIERLRDLHGIHHHLRVLLGARQGTGPWRVDGAVDHDVGHVYAMLGVFLRQHLR